MDSQDLQNELIKAINTIISNEKLNITSTENYSIGNKVRVRIPRNNWNQIYIESKA